MIITGNNGPYLIDLPKIIDKEETFPFMKAIIRFHQKLKEPTGFMTFQVETAEQAMRSSLNVLEKI